MYSGGLRVSEVTHLHYDDISRTNKTIHIRDGKAALTVIPCLLTVHLRYLQNTGLNATDQQGFCFQVHGLAIIL